VGGSELLAKVIGDTRRQYGLKENLDKYWKGRSVTHVGL